MLVKRLGKIGHNRLLLLMMIFVLKSLRNKTFKNPAT
jgi:hypothetical protein